MIGIVCIMVGYGNGVNNFNRNHVLGPYQTDKKFLIRDFSFDHSQNDNLHSLKVLMNDPDLVREITFENIYF